MRNKIFITLMFVVATFVCSGQSFLSKYPKLTEMNLSEFLLDWGAYSDSIASMVANKDSLINMVVDYNYSLLPLDGKTHVSKKYAPPKYHVIPQYIKVERYYLDVDTTMAKQIFGFPSYIPDMKEEQYAVDSITPLSPRKCLYITPDIDKKLSAFAGGLKNGEKTNRIHKNNVSRLREYIPVDYGHWGGYWWFTSFPLITGICYADNLIAVMRRTSWCTGDVIWYVKENGKFVMRQQPVSLWIE